MGGQKPAKQFFRVACVAFHPRFRKFQPLNIYRERKKRGTRYDFGIVVLKSRARFGPNIQPICLEQEQSFKKSVLKDAVFFDKWVVKDADKDGNDNNANHYPDAQQHYPEKSDPQSLYPEEPDTQSHYSETFQYPEESHKSENPEELGTLEMMDFRSLPLNGGLPKNKLNFDSFKPCSPKDNQEINRNNYGLGSGGNYVIIRYSLINNKSICLQDPSL